MKEFKVGDEIKVVRSVYEELPVGTLGTIQRIENGWNDIGDEAELYYLTHDSNQNPMLAEELELVS
jgi:hypothetical protein